MRWPISITQSHDVGTIVIDLWSNYTNQGMFHYLSDGRKWSAFKNNSYHMKEKTSLEFFSASCPIPSRVWTQGVQLTFLLCLTEKVPTFIAHC